MRQFGGEFRLLSDSKASAVPQPAFLNSPKVLSFRPFVCTAQLPFVGLACPGFALFYHHLGPLFEKLSALVFDHTHLVKRHSYRFRNRVAGTARSGEFHRSEDKAGVELFDLKRLPSFQIGLRQGKFCSGTSAHWKS